MPFRPERIGDDFDASAAGSLERQLLDTIRATGMLERTRVRSFDHRSVRAIRALEPELAAGLLVSGTAVLFPSRLARESGCDTYCPDYNFLDEPQIAASHAEGVRVVPWTVNEPAHWERLMAWGVDGITTDYPDRLGEWLHRRGLDC